MRKFIAFMLALVLALGCCSAFAETTEARSSNVTIIVKHYQFTVNKDSGEILGSSLTGDTPLATVTLNRKNYDANWIVSYDGDVEDKITGNTYEITPEKILAVAPKSEGSTKVSVTIKGTANNNTVYYNKNGAEFGSAIIVFTIIWAGEDVDPTNPDGPKTTEGDLTVDIYSYGEHYVGDIVKIDDTTSGIKAQAKLKQSLTSIFPDAADKVTLKYYYAMPGDTVGTEYPAEGLIMTEEMHGSKLKVWAVATLTF